MMLDDVRMMMYDADDDDNKVALIDLGVSKLIAAALIELGVSK